MYILLFWNNLRLLFNSWKTFVWKIPFCAFLPFDELQWLTWRSVSNCQYYLLTLFMKLSTLVIGTFHHSVCVVLCVIEWVSNRLIRQSMILVLWCHISHLVVNMSCKSFKWAMNLLAVTIILSPLVVNEPILPTSTLIRELNMCNCQIFFCTVCFVYFLARNLFLYDKKLGKFDSKKDWFCRCMYNVHINAFL